MATKTESKPSLAPPITVEQWADQEGPPYFELVDGRLKEKPDVAFWHEFLLFDLARWIASYVVERRLGKLATSRGRMRISAHGGREPDILFIPTAQLHLVTKNLFTGVPPLVVEVLSPSNEDEDRVKKFREYAQLGIGEYWIVDFANRRIEIYRLARQADGTNAYELAETFEGEDVVFRPAFFPGLEVPMGEVWPTEFEHRPDVV